MNRLNNHTPDLNALQYLRQTRFSAWDITRRHSCKANCAHREVHYICNQVHSSCTICRRTKASRRNLYVLRCDSISAAAADEFLIGRQMKNASASRVLKRRGSFYGHRIEFPPHNTESETLPSRAKERKAELENKNTGWGEITSWAWGFSHLCHQQKEMDSARRWRGYSMKRLRIMYSCALSTALLSADERNCLQRSFFCALRYTPGERENKKNWYREKKSFILWTLYFEGCFIDFLCVHYVELYLLKGYVDIS